MNNSKKTKLSRDKPSVLYENRYCTQDEFDIVVCGGKKEKGIPIEATKLISPNFRNSVKLSPMLTLRYSNKAAVIGSNIYVFGGFSNWSSSFEMYSAKTNTWKKLVPAIKSLTDFSVCSFMKSVYVIGGFYNHHYNISMLNNIQRYNRKIQSCCYKYDANKWTKVADLQKKRCFSACTVFEGKIVVTGGSNSNGSLRSVEAYDHYDNK